MNEDEKMENKVIKGFLIWMVFATIVAGVLTIQIKKSEASEPSPVCKSMDDIYKYMGEGKLPCEVNRFFFDP